jgi:DNA polymerase (family 10)
MGYSLSQEGVKEVKTGKVWSIKEEYEIYDLLKMQTPEPEMREDTGEIEAAKAQNLPKLIVLSDIRGDLHTHSNFSLEPSHGPGASSIDEMVSAAKAKGYEYYGVADHPPAFTSHTADQIIKLIDMRTKYIQSINSKQKDIRVLNLLETDILPDGVISVPKEGLAMLDFALAGVHSSHRQTKDQMTKRILKALENPYVKVITHPTGRLLNERESYEADWEAVFEYAAKNKKAMEINAFPDRLDLREDLIRMAHKIGVKFVINTDSHALEHLENMRFGVAMARRAWLTKEDVINAWEWKRFANFFGISDS